MLWCLASNSNIVLDYTSFWECNFAWCCRGEGYKLCEGRASVVIILCVLLTLWTLLNVEHMRNFNLCSFSLDCPKELHSLH